ncbi:MAG: hypothetical protein HFI64_00730 [Lachnospiraceae bacterium]|jgi:hypothetical protein|nr:hypothetical protein [Lachnospiraceae bacterium]
MAVDLERMMLLLQKRYNYLKRVDELTDELRSAFDRHDEVSASLLLDMRAEEIAALDNCSGQIWDLAGAGKAEAREVRRLMHDDPFAVPETDCWEENKIFEVRRKTVRLLEELQEKDRRMNLSAGGERSYYRTKEK